MADSATLLSTLQDLDKIKASAQTLHAVGACAVCILRCAGVALGPIYTHEPTDIKKSLGLDTSVETAPCPICLDILSLAVLSQVASAYKAEGFDSLTVSVNIELPKAIYVRQRSAQIILGTKASLDVKDAAKYIVGIKISKDFQIHVDNESEMQVDVTFAHKETAEDHQFLIDREGSGIKTKTFRKHGVYHTTGDSKTAILGELDKCSDAIIKDMFGSPPPSIKEPAQIESIVYRRSPLFIGGRYLKLERNISQTPFIVENKRMTELSVAESIGEPIKKLVQCDSYNLVGSGREDADVRMLGDGRPFYLECTNPRKKVITQEDLSAIQNELIEKNFPVQVRRLQVIKPKDTSIIKEGEEHKTKHYCALVWFASPLSKEVIADINHKGSSEIVLQQKTPIRVLHRRAPLVRPKKLLRLEIAHLEDNFYKVRIESEAGTYIKEFVHGDIGRTTPSLSSMAGDITADILELDVENVSLDFPPAL